MRSRSFGARMANNLIATPRDTPLQAPSLSLHENDNTNNKNNIVWEDNEHDYAYSVQDNAREQHPYATSNALLMPYHRDWDPPPGTTSWNTRPLLNFVSRSDTIGWRGDSPVSPNIFMVTVGN